MKKKRPANSKNQDSLKKKKQRTRDSELVQGFIESISDKMDDFKEIINESNFSNSDIETSNIKPDINNFDSLFEEFTKADFRISPGNLEGFISFQLEEEEAKSFDYVEEPEVEYRYQFTNSEFLAFIAKLDPVEYLIIITLFAILMYANFNKTELEVIYGFLTNTSDAVETILEQEVLQKELKEDIESREKDQSLEDDFNYLNKQIIGLQKQIQQLEAKLNNP